VTIGAVDVAFWVLLLDHGIAVAIDTKPRASTVKDAVLFTLIPLRLGCESKRKWKAGRYPNQILPARKSREMLRDCIHGVECDQGRFTSMSRKASISSVTGGRYGVGSKVSVLSGVPAFVFRECPDQLAGIVGEAMEHLEIAPEHINRNPMIEIDGHEKLDNLLPGRTSGR
jgi:hypothetical protein